MMQNYMVQVEKEVMEVILIVELRQKEEMVVVVLEYNMPVHCYICHLAHK